MTPQRKGLLAAITTILVWTAFIVIGRASAKFSLTPADLVFVRVLGAVLVLLPLSRWLDRDIPSTQKSLWVLSPLPLKPTLLLGFFGGVLYAPLAYTAFFYAPAAHGSVLMPGMLPLSTALMTWVILRERISGQRALGLSLILMGGALVGGLSIWQSLQTGGEVWIGDVLFVTASSMWAVYSVLARKYQVDAIAATVAITVLAALVYLPAYGLLSYTNALPFGIKSNLFGAPLLEIALQMLQQGVGSVVISGISFTLMLKHYGPVRSTMLTAIVPPSSAIAAVIFLGEPLYWNLIAGLVLVVVGILVGVMAASPEQEIKTITYDLYGTNLSLNQASNALNRIIGCQFEARDSLCLGEYFSYQSASGDSFKLRANLDPIDNNPVEMEYQNFPTLLYVTSSYQAIEIHKMLEINGESFTLLRRSMSTISNKPN